MTPLTARDVAHYRSMLLAVLLACHPDAAPPPIYEPAPEVVSTIDMGTHDGPANRLAEAASPYLRMHGHDPVDWHPWGPEAFVEANERGVPVFLSIGYFACHWCHVMHRESFRDPEVAAYLNEHFVSIKVDREERPDVDALYMDALAAMGVSGGWPASLWLTPDGDPFFGGTYYPPEASRGRPGFLDVLQEIRSQWTGDLVQLRATGQQLRRRLEVLAAPTATQLPGPAVADIAARATAEAWDPTHRGWSQRSQFPLAPRLQFLLDWAARQPAEQQAEALTVLTGMLEAMDEGGLHDHLGGGFHRYTVDADWSVPHYEKMLYDNAQLIDVYAQAAVLTGRPRYRAVVSEAVGWLAREMQHDSGAFYSSQGADSPDGEEGSYYQWTRDEIAATLPDPAPFLAAYPLPEGAAPAVLRRAPGADPDALAIPREQLRRVRTHRPAPPTDTKLVVAWNGLAIRALARAGRLLGEDRYLSLAEDAAEAVLAAVDEDGSLPRVLGDEQSPPGVLADYAFAAEGLLALYEATGEPRWLVAADALAGAMVTRFQSPDGGVYLSAAEDLIVSQTHATDGSEPSPPGRAAAVLLRLAALGAPHGDRAAAEDILRTADRALRRDPTGSPSIAGAAMLAGLPTLELVVSADRPDDPRAVEMRAAIDAALRPGAVSATLTPDRLAALDGYTALLGKGPGDSGVRGFVCTDGVCKSPTDDPTTFRAQLETASANARTPR